MPYAINSNYHGDPIGYFYKSNSPVTITYIPIYTTNHSFLIYPPLPSGLSIDSSNGTITGTTALNTLSDSEYAVTVSTIEPNSIIANVVIRIVISTEPKFTYLITSYTFKADTLNTLIIESPIRQALLWDDDYYFTLTPPSGSDTNIMLYIDNKTGTITGTFNTPNKSIKIYTVKIINKFIEYEQTISIITVAPLKPIEYIGLSVTNGGIFEFIQGIFGSLQPDAIINYLNNGKFSISGCTTSTQLPSGLSFNTNTGTISGVPETILEPHIYNITFADSFESIKVSITFCIKRRYRLTPSLSYDTLITPELQMRKKAEILQHNSNRCNESKKQTLYKLITRGSNNSRSVECLSRNVLISSSSSDVPGPSINLFYDPTIQLLGNATRLRPNNILP